MNTLSNKPPFQGLMVLEIATVLAGPSVGLFFAELGATVIKIESPHNHDVTRSWKIAAELHTEKLSAYFAGVNYGKQFRKIDLRSAAEKTLFEDLVRNADILIVNFKPGDAEKLGCTYEHLSKINKRLIYAALTSYGLADSRPGYDALLQAACGFMHLNRMPDAAPQKIPVAMIDILAAHQLKEGILTALYNREKTGEGVYLQTSLFASGITALANQASAFLWAKSEPQPSGSEHPSIVPYGTVFYDQNHKPLCLAVGNDKQFLALCRTLKISHVGENELFKTNLERVKNRKILIPILQEAIGKEDRDILIKLLIQEKVPAEAVCTVSEALNTAAAQELMVSIGSQTLLHSVAFETVPPSWLQNTYSSPE
ncbi:MAG: CoA transferase [Bacteroidia bacterium]|nr:CoA transferase [Bacteroidia bacterium]